MWSAANWLAFQRRQWNLVLASGIIIFLSVSHIATPPTLGPEELVGSQQYENTARTITILLLALSVIPCYWFKLKKHSRWWWATALLLLLLAFSTYYCYQSFYKNYTINDKEFGYGILVKGNTYLQAIQQQRVEYSRQSNGSFPTDEQLIAGSMGQINRIWPQHEIIRNANLITGAYFLTVALLTLMIICTMQSIYCVTAKPVKNRKVVDKQ